MSKNELIRQINGECKDFCGYDIFTMGDMIANYCIMNNITTHSKEWEELIKILWGNLDKSIRVDFSDVYEFEVFMRENFV